ncbi:NFX1-type zinc finger-containing protein 1-like isoform X3 [Thrips palmi]|uniref:NFX1-type zinc finger-containing protein 1-like isoform X3 n=1 Tax=Thrips palmi TaxID=161013 RepID=A0A6P8YQX5_THRPL|nr:NFX1-type zinc finger-containing protein 1-like isoform X3 [Thrips palmi]
MTLHRGPLFPTDADLCSTKPRKSPKPIKRFGPYKDVKDLLEVHIDLVSEAFIRSVREQLDKFRADAAFWESATCYSVEVKELNGADVEVHFDASKYVWDEERRFLFHNLVFLTQNHMQDFVIGLVIGSDKEQLKKGSAIIKLIRGVDAKGRGKFLELDAQPYLNRKFTLMESRAFYFPHLHVTNALRRDLKDLKNAEAPLADFHDEIVFSRVQNPPEGPLYLQSFRKMRLDASESKSLNKKFQTLQRAMSSSQRNALKSVLTHRVALVQGPPGTGKTYEGCKIAEYLVELKKLPYDLLPGPILVVTTTNHSVREFLSRCLDFSDKVIHGYSQKHDKETYGPLQDQYNRDMSSSERLKLMRSADVLSMTTTRAAYIRPTLDSLHIKVVEEAAREMEGFVLASIPRGAQHLILLGDHKQLRPICDNALGYSHHLTLSLFERLINNGVTCPMLNEQRRMRPEIADLIRSIYPALTDHESTRNRPPVEGVDLRVPVFFLDHQEREVQDGSGFYNPWEAKMVAMLCHYLLVQGHPAEEITILAAYRKQIACISKEIEEIRGTRFGIRVCTIDGFQGEENTIIILSLVRSNPEGKIGFLREDNRTCVALSRAKNGFFLVGDLKCLTESGSAVWNHVLKTVNTGGPLPLKCRHGRTIGGKSPAHFQKALCCVCRVHAAVQNAQAFLDKGQDLVEKTEESLTKLEDELETRNPQPGDHETRDGLKGRLASLKKSVRNWGYKKMQAEEGSQLVDEWFKEGLIHCEDTDEALQVKILNFRGLNRIPAPSSGDMGLGVAIYGFMDVLVERWKPTWKRLAHEIKKYFNST